jgi:lysophospholipase L1-like esterase
MEIKNTIPITLDFRKPSKIPMPQVHQYDTNEFEFTVLENGTPADLSTVDRIVANYRRPDKSVITREILAVGNVITYPMGAEEMAVEGLGELNVQLFAADRRLSSMAMKIYVHQNLGAAFEGGEGLPLLQELFVEVSGLIEDTQSNSTYALNQGDYAKEQADIAQAESANLSQLKTDAQTATDSANTAAGLAQTNASEAETQGIFAKEQGDYAKAEADRLVGTDVSTLSAQLAQKANLSDVANISNGTPVFADTVGEMTDTSRAYVNTSDGLLYLYDSGTSSFVSSGVQYQSTGIADETVSLNKLKTEIQRVLGVTNSVVTKKNVRNPYHVKGQPNPGYKLYIEYIFDTNGLNLVNSGTNHVSFTYHSKDNNLLNISGLIYQNNDPLPSGLSGGSALSTGVIENIVLNEDRNIEFDLGVYTSTYRYAHILTEVEVTDKYIDSEYWVRNMEYTVGNVPVTNIIHVGAHRLREGGVVDGNWYEPYYDTSSMDTLASDVNRIESQLNSLSLSRFAGTKVNFLGDSISDPNHKPEYKKYYTFLDEFLGLSVVRNYGIASSTIAKGANTLAYGPMCERYLSMNDDADLVTVFAGTNDYGYSDATFGEMFNADGTVNKDTSTFYGGCHVLFEGLLKKYAARGTTILIMTPIPRAAIITPNPTTGKYLKDYVNAIKEVAAYYSLPVLDLYTMSGLQINITEVKDKYAPDKTHPNTAGHEVIANRLLGKLKTL